MAFEEITPEMFTETSEETQEVAEPAPEATEQGVEEPEVAEQASEEPDEKPGKTEADAAFAEMRRRAEEAERQKAEVEAKLADLEAKATARAAAMANMDVDEVEAIAEQAGISKEDVINTIKEAEAAAAAAKDVEEKEARIKELEAELQEVYVASAMKEDLTTIQSIDSSVKSLEDLGEDFAAYVAAGLSAEQAYYAIKGKEIATKPTPPEAPGKISDTAPAPKDYFTEEEVNAMTSDEKSKNWEKIMASLPHWK